VLCFRKVARVTPMPPDAAWTQLELVADCAITSSPYAGKGEVFSAHNGIDWTKAAEPTGTALTPGRHMQPYSTHPANLGNMPEGSTPVEGDVP
jgi:hypothetical protein